MQFVLCQFLPHIRVTQVSLMLWYGSALAVVAGFRSGRKYGMLVLVIRRLRSP